MLFNTYNVKLIIKQMNIVKIPVGIENFREVVLESDLFADKSLFIKDIIDSQEAALLFAKPRRWGKSLNADMLKRFFSIKVDNEGNKLSTNPDKILFSGGSITDEFGKNKVLPALNISLIDNAEYMRFQGQYPVISITFKDINGKNFDEMLQSVKNKMIDLFNQYSYLEKSLKISQYDRELFYRYYKGVELTTYNIEHSLEFLTKLLHMHFGQKAYVIIDEYDKPVNSYIQELLSTKSSKDQITKESKNIIYEISELIRDILSNCGKTNDNLKKIVIFGILESLTKEWGSGFNNLSVYGMMDFKFSSYFGFDSKEITNFIGKFNFIDKGAVEENQGLIDTIFAWYCGYKLPIDQVPTLEICNPWSVMKYLDKMQTYASAKVEPETYWGKSGTNQIIRSIFNDFPNQAIKDKFHFIIKGKEQLLAYNKLSEFMGANLVLTNKVEELLSYLLLSSGYLAVSKRGDKYAFKIPNLEIKNIFLSELEEEINSENKDRENLKILLYGVKQTSSKILMKAILNKDYLTAENIMKYDKLKCYGDSFNLKPIHLAAALYSGEFFLSMLKICGNKILDSQDNSQPIKLKPFDYAFLFNNTEVKDIINSTSPKLGETVLKIPDSSFLCYFYTLDSKLTFLLKTSVTGIIGGIMGNFISKCFKSKETATTAIGAIVGATLGEFSKEGLKFGLNSIGYSFERKCEEHVNYYNVNNDIQNKNVTSLLAFEKYILDHPNQSYVSLEPCDKGMQLSNFSTTIFHNYSDEEVVYYLCDLNHIMEKHIDLVDDL